MRLRYRLLMVMITILVFLIWTRHTKLPSKTDTCTDGERDSKTGLPRLQYQSRSNQMSEAEISCSCQKTSCKPAIHCVRWHYPVSLSLAYKLFSHQLTSAEQDVHGITRRACAVMNAHVKNENSTSCSCCLWQFRSRKSFTQGYNILLPSGRHCWLWRCTANFGNLKNLPTARLSDPPTY